MTKVALVTGGAIRVGRAVVLMLAKAGMDIAFTWKTSEQEAISLEQEVIALGQRVCSIQVDISQPDAVDKIVKKFEKKYARLDALVNNASSFDPTKLGEVDNESFDVAMATNARFPLMLTQAFAKKLAENFNRNIPSSTGRVVNFIDTHVLGEPLRDYISYNTTKAALREITNTFALELAPAVTVNAVAPGVVVWADSYTEQAKQEFLDRVPLDRVGTTEDAASAVKFLVMDAHYCTGQVLKVDGGRHLT